MQALDDKNKENQQTLLEKDKAMQELDSLKLEFDIFKKQE
jgi:hypothetical protein